MTAVATMACMQVCPMVTGIIPHVGGIVAMGMPDMLVGMLPVATVGCVTVCIGPPGTIVLPLDPLFLLNMMPVAEMGSLTDHGGVITVGVPLMMTVP